MDTATFNREMAGWLLGQGLAILILVWGVVKSTMAREKKLIEAERREAIGKAIEAHDDEANAHQTMRDRWEQARERQLMLMFDGLSSRIERITIAAALAHDENPRAHQVAREFWQAPILAKLDHISTALAELVTEHRTLTKKGYCPLPRDEEKKG